jgi:NAD+ synthase (glutamine-hydrolysing)
VIFGTPFLINGNLANCALFISCGKLLGIIPKQMQNRWFDATNTTTINYNDLDGKNYEIQVSDNLIFTGNFNNSENEKSQNYNSLSNCKIGICVGFPSVNNLYKLAESEVAIFIDSKPYSFEKSKNLQQEIISLSKISKQAIIYLDSNANESTTDFVYNSNMYISECGKLLNNNDLDENSFFETKTISAEIDIDIIRGIKKKSENLTEKVATFNNLININFDFPLKNTTEICSFFDDKKISNYSDPFFTNEIENTSKALEIIDIQALGLAKRLKSTNLKSVVIGVSGGIDSTLALLVCERCFEILQYDKKNIFAISMPGLGTSSNTKNLAKELAEILEVTFTEVSINQAVKQHFKDINHDENKMDLVYENSQARQRTMILFDFANKIGGIVIGTGDMSEIALGWSTYNADHISNYNVNAGIPKTVAKSILQNFANYSRNNDKNLSINSDIKSKKAKILAEILKNPISPELLPAEKTGKIQATEEILGPYELHDFFLFYHLSYFLSKEKLLFIANFTFKNIYEVAIIEKTLNIFWKRFHLNQYKRSCSADGVNIFEISLSPRNGFIFPSDFEKIN